MKNSLDLGRCYPPRPAESMDNNYLDLQNSSYPTQPYSIIANHLFSARERADFNKFCNLIGS